MDAKVSVFVNFNEVKENFLLEDILSLIRDGHCKSQVLELRKLLESDKLKEYDKSKKALPAFTPSGVFADGRKLENLLQYNNCIILDIDKLEQDKLVQVKSLVCKCPYTYACFISPSNKGLKIIVVSDVPSSDHKKAFNLIKEYYERMLQIEIDKSGKDITRLCFMSWDPELFINPDFLTFKISDIMLKNEIEYLIQQIEYRKADITGGYENWLSIGFALADGFGPSGRDYFHRISQFSEDYNFENCNEQYDKCLNSQGQGITIKSLFYLAKEKGIDVSRIKSVDLGSEKKSDEQKSDKKKDKVKTSIIIEQIERYLSSAFNLRFNMVTGHLEYCLKTETSFKPMIDYVENSIYRELLKRNIPCGMDRLRSLLKSDFCIKYNPFHEFFKNLPEWDEKTDHILALAKTVSTTNDALWHECFRKWIVASVASVLDDKVVNHTVIIFSGPQGIGKTTWMENLCPYELTAYKFTGTINPGNKDTLIFLSECMFINMDELENMNRTEIGTFKEIITKSTIRLRRAYGHNNENLIRRASFMGSVNTSQFLSDTTGSRRFLCFEVTDINYLHTVDLHNVFSQALYLYNAGFKFYFDRSDIESISVNNDQYQVRTAEEELLLVWYTIPKPDDYPLYLSASQILARLAEKSKINVSTGSAISIGKALRKNGFTRCKRGGSWVWAVREYSWDQVEENTKKQPSPDCPF